MNKRITIVHYVLRVLILNFILSLGAPLKADALVVNDPCQNDWPENPPHVEALLSDGYEVQRIGWEGLVFNGNQAREYRFHLEKPNFEIGAGSYEANVSAATNDSQIISRYLLPVQTSATITSENGTQREIVRGREIVSCVVIDEQADFASEELEGTKTVIKSWSSPFVVNSGASETLEVSDTTVAGLLYSYVYDFDRNAEVLNNTFTRATFPLIGSYQHPKKGTLNFSGEISEASILYEPQVAGEAYLKFGNLDWDRSGIGYFHSSRAAYQIGLTWGDGSFEEHEAYPETRFDANTSLREWLIGAYADNENNTYYQYLLGIRTTRGSRMHSGDDSRENRFNDREILYHPFDLALKRSAPSLDTAFSTHSIVEGSHEVRDSEQRYTKYMKTPGQLPGSVVQSIFKSGNQREITSGNSQFRRFFYASTSLAPQKPLYGTAVEMAPYSSYALAKTHSGYQGVSLSYTKNSKGYFVPNLQYVIDSGGLSWRKEESCYAFNQQVNAMRSIERQIMPNLGLPEWIMLNDECP